jgi:hypothetical protein
VLECVEHAGVTVLCGLQNPEDLALLPGGERVLVSEFGGMDGASSGWLSVVDVASGEVERLFPRDGVRALAPEAAWGDAACPGPPDTGFSPHGIDLARRPDGRLELLVVNHAGRESIELFEVEAGPPVALAWRGCVPVPESGVLNDVVALPEGGLLATRMFEASGSVAGVLLLVRAALGLETGWVLEWQPGAGFREVPGTRSSLPNGIELSADGAVIYLNLYGANEVRRIERRSGETLSTVALDHPDNSTWASDGRLLVASHPGSLSDITACNGIEAGACPMRYEIVALSPDLAETELLYANEGPPMGAGTVALEVADELWIGSFAGDRIARVTRP